MDLLEHFLKLVGWEEGLDDGLQYDVDEAFVEPLMLEHGVDTNYTQTCRIRTDHVPQLICNQTNSSLLHIE